MQFHAYAKTQRYSPEADTLTVSSANIMMNLPREITTQEQLVNHLDECNVSMGDTAILLSMFETWQEIWGKPQEAKSINISKAEYEDDIELMERAGFGKMSMNRMSQNKPKQYKIEPLKMLSFIEWCSRKVRHPKIGFLCSDILSDSDFPKPTDYQKECLDYLKSRGTDEAVIAVFNLAYALYLDYLFKPEKPNRTIARYQSMDNDDLLNPTEILPQGSLIE